MKKFQNEEIPKCTNYKIEKFTIGETEKWRNLKMEKFNLKMEELN